jgi:hypothetical protein
MAARALVVVLLVALVAATLTGCQDNRTKTTGAPSRASSATPTAPTTAADATSSPLACVAHQHVNHAAGVRRTRSSRLLKYQMAYPAGWRLTTACRRWRFGEPGDQSVPGTIDDYESPGRPAFVVSSQEIPAGMTLMQWLPTYMRGQPPSACWPAPNDWGKLRIAGHPARLRGGNSVCSDATEAVTVDGRTAYVFTGYTNASCCTVFNVALFKTFLDSVKFPPRPARGAP